MERNRRLAWMLYLRARDELVQHILWGAELAEWLETLVPELPTACKELIDLVTPPVEKLDRIAVRRYVRNCLSRA